MQSIVTGANREIPKYPEGPAPEPAFILTLPNEVYNGASLFAVQKSFEGEFSFDVYYDAPGVKKLDCAFFYTSLHFLRTMKLTLLCFFPSLSQGLNSWSHNVQENV